MQNIEILAVDPGFIGATEIMREQNIFCKFAVEKVVKILTPFSEALFSNSLLRSPIRSANDIVCASLDLREKAYNESLKAKIINGKKLEVTGIESRDQQKQGELWDLSSFLVSLTPAEKKFSEVYEPEASTAFRGPGGVY